MVSGKTAICTASWMAKCILHVRSFTILATIALHKTDMIFAALVVVVVGFD